MAEISFLNFNYCILVHKKFLSYSKQSTKKKKKFMQITFSDNKALKTDEKFIFKINLCYLP